MCAHRGDVGAAAGGRRLAHRRVDHLERLPQQPPRHAHRVAALPHEVAAAERRVHLWRRRRWRWPTAHATSAAAAACTAAAAAAAEAERRLDCVGRRQAGAHLEVAYRAQLGAVAHELREPRRDGVVQPVEGLKEDEAALGGERRERVGLGGVARQRLLAHHVLARAQRRRRPLVVQAVEQRDVDGLDGLVGQHRRVVARPRDAPALGERACARRVARADGHDRRALVHASGVEQAVRSYLGRAQEAKAHGVGRGRRVVDDDAQQPRGDAAEGVGEECHEGGGESYPDAQHITGTCGKPGAKCG